MKARYGLDVYRTTISSDIELVCKFAYDHGGNPKLLILEGMGHNDAINYAYESTDLMEWLLTQRRTDFTPVDECCSQYF